MECYFGEIVENEIVLNDAGEKIREIWEEIPRRYKNVILDSFIIMPNHLHGILIFGAGDDGVVGGRGAELKRADVGGHSAEVDAMNRVRTLLRGGVTGGKNPMLAPFSLSAVMRWFKGRCTFEVRKLEGWECFGWHSRFFDRIVRPGDDLNRIREYIRNNSFRWEKDKYNPKNLPGGIEHLNSLVELKKTV